MTSSQLVGSSFVDGQRMPHYVNGRLLAAEDLKADQDATLARLSWLGQAIGPGVVDGLFVSAGATSATSVQVTPGLGLSRSGHVVRLPNAVTLALSPPSSASPTANEGRFVECTPPAGDGPAGLLAGVYLLTAMPASQMNGMAPLKSAPGSAMASCASQWEVDGVQFKAIRLDGPAPSLSNAATSRIRNLVAHWCFGSEALRDLARDPFHFSDAFTGLDQISPTDLSPCDLPLAVFRWSGSTLAFVDPWSARRRTIRPYALTEWTGLLSDKRVAEGQARFLQFQQQLDELLLAAAASTTAARTHFRYLPPVGFVPVRLPNAFTRRLAGGALRKVVGVEQLQPTFAPVASAEIFRQLAPTIETALMSQIPAAGFDVQAFFGNLPRRIGIISRERVDFLLQRSWYDEALDLDDEQARFDLYLVDENWQAMVLPRLPGAVDTALAGVAGIAAPQRAQLVNMVRTAVAAQRKGMGNMLGFNAAGLPVFVSQNRLYVIFAKQPGRITWMRLRQDND